MNTSRSHRHSSRSSRRHGHGRRERGELSEVSSEAWSEPEAGEIPSDIEKERPEPTEPITPFEDRPRSPSPHTPPLPPKAYERYIPVESNKRKLAMLQTKEDENRKSKDRKKKRMRESEPESPK